MLVVLAAAFALNLPIEIPSVLNLQFEVPSWLQPKSRPPEAIALRDQLVQGDGDSGELQELVEACCAARVPFRAELLGDGELWRATPVKGRIPRWQRNRNLIPTLRNRAGQAYQLAGASDGSVVNYGEVLGRALYFKAEGSFSKAPTSSGNRCPQDFDVKVTQGGFVLGGRAFVSGAISGPGFLRCLYLDEDVRIFESPTTSPDRWEEAGLIVVQVRDALFEDPVEGTL